MEKDAITILYIVGASYSGSTLLALMLNAHSRIGSTGEVWGPPAIRPGGNYSCSCGELLNRCDFWRSAERHLNSDKFQLTDGIWGLRLLSANPTFRERLLFASLRSGCLETIRDNVRAMFPGFQGRINAMLELNEKFVAYVANYYNKPIVVDSSKDPMRFASLARMPSVRMKALHLVRHPAAFVLSARNYHEHPTTYLCAHWSRNYQTCVRQLGRASHVPSIQIRYEDLCREPEQTLEKLCGFLGTRFEPEMLDFRSREHHVWGNAMRLGASSTIRADERWKRLLTRSEIERIVRSTQPVAGLCGYTADGTEPILGRA